MGYETEKRVKGLESGGPGNGNPEGSSGLNSYPGPKEGAESALAADSGSVRFPPPAIDATAAEWATRANPTNPLFPVNRIGDSAEFLGVTVNDGSSDEHTGVRDDQTASRL